jgi:hypothetical protein
MLKTLQIPKTFIKLKSPYFLMYSTTFFVDPSVAVFARYEAISLYGVLNQKTASIVPLLQ